MKLHLLGVNGPFPESLGATSGYLLETENELFQLDLGSGILASLTSLTAPEAVSAILISHWHYDHTADLPVLMYRLQSLDRILPVYGPEDASSSIFQLVSSVPCFSFSAVSPGDFFTIGNTQIRVAYARHPVPSVGYVLSGNGKIFGYTGDTNVSPSLFRDFDHCDLLLADGLFPSDMWTDEKPHLSAALAARLAVETRAGNLIITHLNPLIPRHVLLEEARTVFSAAQLAEAGAIVEI